PAATTTVMCTATDDSGNSASASFTVTVARLRVVFGEPVGWSRTVTVHSGRTLPIKVQIFRASEPDETGPVWLRVTQLDACPSLATTKAAASGKGASARDRRLGSVRSSSIETSFRWDAGAERWTYSVDLGDWGLVAGGCYRADVID